MSEISNEDQLTAQGEELDDFDVEGHGLKEIALGLSAASIVAGGVGATALALDNPIPGTTAGVQATVAGAQKDVQSQRDWAERLAGNTAERAGEAAEGALSDVNRLSAWADRTVTTTTTPVTQRVDATVAEATAMAEQTIEETTQLAHRVVDDPIGTTDRIVDRTITTVRETRDEAVTTAKDTVVVVEQTAATAVTTAQQTAGTAVTTAGQAAGEAAETALSAAGDVQELVNPQASVHIDEEGATVQAGAAGVTVTISHG